MPDGTLQTRDDVDDFVRGLTLLGTGGGGHPHLGRQYLFDFIDVGQPLHWVDLDAIPDEAWICTVFGMGSIAPQEVLSEEEQRRFGYAGVQVADPMAKAVRELAEYTGRDIQAIVAFEPGASNTTAPFAAATRLGLDFVDADFAGRAIPELAQTTAGIAGQSMWPAAICDHWGNTLILKSAPTVMMAERLGKHISMVTKFPDPYKLCAHAGFMLTAAEMKRLVIPGTLSRSRSIGAAIRTARNSGSDPVAAVVEALDGWRLFTGTVTSKEWKSRDGYMFGTTHIQGNGKYEGHTCAIWFQNENHIVWIDEAPFVTSPDLIMIVDGDTAEPFTNTVLSEGDTVAVLGARADDRYRTEEGLTALGPGHFGFDLPYRPIETVVGA